MSQLKGEKLSITRNTIVLGSLNFPNLSPYCNND